MINNKQIHIKAFISSTYLDLTKERKEVVKSLEVLNEPSIRMENFGAKQGSPLKVCLRELHKCNYYIGIIGSRYGNQPHCFSISLTEFEYEAAKRKGIARKIYVRETKNPFRKVKYALQSFREGANKRRKLKAFKQKIKQDNCLSYFDSPHNLVENVHGDIIRYYEERISKIEEARIERLDEVKAGLPDVDKIPVPTDAGLSVAGMKEFDEIRELINNGDLDAAKKTIKDLLK